MWEKLIDVLGKLGLVYDSLAKLGERKRDALVGVDMEGLSKILDEEQLLAAKIQRLEKQRGEILQELAKTDRTVDEKTKATDFYKSAPTRAMEERLTMLHKTLGKNVDRATKIRDNNQVLARGALDAVTASLNKLTAAAVEPTYGKGGDTGVLRKKALEYDA